MTFWHFTILNFPNSHILYCEPCLFPYHHSLISLSQKQHIMPDTLTFTSVHNIPGSRGPGCGQPALPYRRREATRNYRYSQRGLVAHHLNNGYNEPAIRRARQRGKTLLRHSYLPAVNPTRRCNACRVTEVRMSLSFSLSRRLVLVATRFTFIVWSTFSTI